MKYRSIMISLFALAGILILFNYSAADQSSAAGELRVGVKPAAPFVMPDDDGGFEGISIDLWNAIADDLGAGFEFYVYDLEPLLDSLAAGEPDVAVAALTMTAEREKNFDFTHAYFKSGLGIAVKPGGGGGWKNVVARFVDMRFLQIILILALLIFIVGALVWLFERKHNQDQFGGSPARGLGAGFWWSAVTMTTVGYGDKAPVTLLGRIVGLIWMFAAIIILSSFTAAITSVLTVSSLESAISGPGDLPGARVGTVAGTASTVYLDENHIRFRGYESIDDGLRAVADGDIEAFVYDKPIIQYKVNQSYKGRVAVLPVSFAPQQYGFGLPPGSPLREKINLALLKTIRNQEWKQVLNYYLGENDD